MTGFTNLGCKFKLYSLTLSLNPKLSPISLAAYVCVHMHIYTHIILPSLPSPHTDCSIIIGLRIAINDQVLYLWLLDHLESAAAPMCLNLQQIFKINLYMCMHVHEMPEIDVWCLLSSPV